MTNFETIGGLREALRNLDPAAAVYIDNRRPTALSSYRGHYDQLAIECTTARHERTEIDGRGEQLETYSSGNSEVRIKADPTVADLIDALDLADGAVFEGYKGGQFGMDKSTDLWVSEWGQVDHLRIATIELSPGRVDLATCAKEW